MPVLIALLRGVNVVGRHRISMDALRRMCESLGCQSVQTLLQSGNVVASVPDRSVSKLAQRIEQAIEAELSFRPLVITRTVAEIRETIANNPFAGREGIEPSKYLVTFFPHQPAQEARERVLAMETAPEELYIRGREVYMYFPNGIGRPKTKAETIEKALGIRGTGRNWSTVTKLLAMSSILETSVPGDRTKTRSRV